MVYFCDEVSDVRKSCWLNHGVDYLLVFPNIGNRPSIPQYGFSVTQRREQTEWRNKGFFFMRHKEKAKGDRYFSDPLKAIRM